MTYQFFSKNVKKLCQERFTELPNITKLEVKLKESLLATSVWPSKEHEPGIEDTSVASGKPSEWERRNDRGRR